jgi:hypothetical protein
MNDQIDGRRRESLRIPWYGPAHSVEADAETPAGPAGGLALSGRSRRHHDLLERRFGGTQHRIGDSST